MLRMKNLVACLVALMAFSFVVPAPAMAFGWKRYDRQSKSDPYAYRYEHRGYYPYYGSRYWRPTRQVRRRRFRFKQPRYHPAWGYYRRHSHPHRTVRPHTHRRHHW
jgi:hypothetical protein